MPTEQEIKDKLKEDTQKAIALTAPQKITNRSRAYRLEYRYKNRFGITNGKVNAKIFWFEGNLKEAVQRARLHCERMGYTFVYCNPYIVDLEAQEELKERDLEGYLEGEEY